MAMALMRVRQTQRRPRTRNALTPLTLFSVNRASCGNIPPVMAGAKHVLITSIALASLAVVAGCGGSSEKPPPPPGPTVSLASYDDFNRDLAARVARVLGAGAAPEFQVVATPVSDPIGTLYLKGRSVAADDTSCRPASNPDARSMPNAFPAYSFGSTLAGELGIDSGVLQGVASAGATLSNESAFTFSVGSPHLQVLSDAALKTLVGTSVCKAAIQKDMVLVRGYVTGQRSFVTSGKLAAGASASVTQVGSLKISVASNGAVNISDDATQPFLQVITEVAPPAGGTAPVTVSAPAQMTGPGRIYIQQDGSDDMRKGSGVARSLQAAGFNNVVPQVERTASARTPKEAQVRYFNDADKAQAIEVLKKLQQQYPGATLVAMKIPAPRGQIEVWLPRVK
jgi:hypothetical protein